MNIIPLVLSFLLVIAFTSFSLLKERQTTKIESASYIGHMDAVREMRNKLEEEEYEARSTPPEKPREKKESKPKPISSTPAILEPRTPKEAEEHKKKREAMRTSSYSHFNLHPLLKKKPALALDYAEKLLLKLYSHAPFFQEAQKKEPKLARALLDLILESAEKQKETFSFSLCLAVESPLKEILYKMLKGTNTYDLENKEGYPPLDEYFSYDPKIKKPIHLHFASHPLRQVLFNQKVLNQIDEKENEKWEARKNYIYVRKAELKEILTKLNQDPILVDMLDPYLNWDRASPKDMIVSTKKEKNRPNLKKRIRMRPAKES